MSRCSKQGWCPAMRARLSDGVGAGLSVLNLLNFKTGEERVGGIVFKRDRRDKGIVLNVCPWCESRIFWIGTRRRRAGTPNQHKTNQSSQTISGSEVEASI